VRYFTFLLRRKILRT